MFRKSPALSPPGALGDFHDKPDRRQVKQSEGQPVQGLDAGEQPDGCRERGDGPAQNTGGGKRHRPAQANPTQQPRADQQEYHHLGEHRLGPERADGEEIDSRTAPADN